MPTLRAPVTGSLVKTIGSVMKRPASFGQHCRTGRDARLGWPVSTTSRQGADRTCFGPALATSKRSPSFFSLSTSETGMRMSRSLATRADRSLRCSTPSAAAIRSGEPKALMSTGVSKPSTLSKSRAWLRSAGPFETRSVISAISRSRETRARTRLSCPVFSRWATNSRRSSKATRLLVVVELDEPARDDGEGEARHRPHHDEVPAHQRRLPGNDALDAKERPGGHVGHERSQGHARVCEDDEERHADHGPARGEEARHRGEDDGGHARLLSEVAGHRLLGNEDLEHTRQNQGRDEAGQDEPDELEARLGAERGKAGILPVRDAGGGDGQDEKNDVGKLQGAALHAGIIRHPLGYTTFEPARCAHSCA